MRFMCEERPLTEEVAVTLETREDAVRNAAANVEKEALADGLARDRRRLRLSSNAFATPPRRALTS
ncbi:MAG: hypothetical protein BRD44_01590 [Bacteroidetes bacterium QS_7_67_15]|nr:MAG: hypothetical protein BRD44_01590 [Bacteroidetes bacterium QS_7_67_15]